jgi:hypothetical protein
MNFVRNLTFTYGKKDAILNFGNIAETRYV